MINLNINCKDSDLETITTTASTLLNDNFYLTANNQNLIASKELYHQINQFKNKMLLNWSLTTRIATACDFFTYLLNSNITENEVSNLELSTVENFNTFHEYMHSKGYVAFIKDAKTITHAHTNNKLKEPYTRNVNNVQSLISWNSFAPYVFKEKTFYRNDVQRKADAFEVLLQQKNLTKETFCYYINPILENLFGKDLIIINYEKQNKLPFTKNELSIYSPWSVNFINQFTTDDPLVIPNTNTYYPTSFTKERIHSDFSTRSWSESNVLATEYGTHNSNLSIGFTAAAFTILDINYNTFSNAPDENHTSFTSLVKEQVSLQGSRRRGFLLNSFKRPNSRFYSLVNYTQKQVSSRKGFFFPMLVPVVTLNESLDFIKSYYYTFAIFDDFETIIKRKQTKSTLNSFSKKYFIKEGIYFYDNENYQNSLRESFGSNSFKYSSDLFEILETLSTDNISALKALNSQPTSKQFTFSSKMNSVLAAKVNVDSKIETKYKKLKEKFKQLHTKRTECINFTNSEIYDISATADNIIHNRNQIKLYKKKIENLESLLHSSKKKLVEALQTLEDTTVAIHTNQNQFKRIEEAYHLDVKSKLDSNSYSSSEFFNSLAKDSIKITSVHFKSEKGPLVKVQEETAANISSLLKMSLNRDDYKIKEVAFIIDKPSRIVVDGNPKKVVYGGPYKVKVTNKSISIALAYPNSLFGYNSSGTCFIHPHAARTDFESGVLKQRYSNACLGEASPLLYNSFDKNDLRMIILSAMTWINSANSSDTWGAFWHVFPKTINEDFIDVQECEENISDNEVDEFLSLFEEEVEEGEEETPEPQVQTVQQTQQTQEEPVQVAPPAFENPNTYVRYTNP